MPDEGNDSKPADGDPQIKVTDRRMFTPDGRLRDEYQFLDKPAPSAAGSAEPTGKAGTADPSAAPAPPAPQRPAEVPAPAAPTAAAPPGAEQPLSDRQRRPDLAEFSGPESVGVLDLVAMLAESAAVYLGDAELPDGSSGEQLEMARVHIDLLEVLRQKTTGNLSAQESAVLEDVLYRLRVRYVQKRG